MWAETTNALTNGLHALCLLLYFCGSVRHRRMGHVGFNPWVVSFFLILFVLKIMGVYVHYEPHGEYVMVVWGAISMIVILMNYVILRAVGAPNWVCFGAVVFSLSASSLFVLISRDFTFLAAPVAVIGMTAAYFSRSMLRVGFVAVVVSNIVWIGARKITSWVIGGEVPEAYRFDNDIYHFLLIFSTFLIYKGISRGNLQHPKASSPLK